VFATRAMFSRATTADKLFSELVPINAIRTDMGVNVKHHPLSAAALDALYVPAEPRSRCGRL
jgi:hypothetical protein